MRDNSANSGTNITLADAVMASVRKAQLEMFVHLPGVVKTFDPATQTISVQPSIDRQLKDKTIVKLPLLSDVPVIYQRSAAGSFSFPLAEGDHVLLCFSQRSLDKWKDQGPGLPPSDNRIFDISDAFAIPGAYPISEPLDPPPDGVDFRATKKFKLSGGEELEISAPNKVDIKSEHINLSKEGSPTDPAVLGSVLQANLEDLIDAINDLVALITAGSILVTAAPGPGAPIVSTIVTTPVESALASVKSALPDENSQIVKLE